MNSLFLIIGSLINIYFFIMQNIEFLLLYILTEAYTFSTNIGFRWLLLIVYYLFLIYLYMRNYLKDLCLEEKDDNGQTVVNHHFLAKYNPFFNFISKYPVFFWLYLIPLLLNLGNCISLKAGWGFMVYNLFTNVVCVGGYLNFLLRLSKWFNKKPELVEHDIKIKMDYFLFFLVSIVIPGYFLIYIIYIDKDIKSYLECLLVVGLVCIAIYYKLQPYFMDKTEDNMIKHGVRLNVALCILVILFFFNKYISFEELQMLYYSIDIEPITRLQLKDEHLLDPLISAELRGPQDVDPELANLRRAEMNASRARQRFLEQIMTSNWAETRIEHVFSHNDIQIRSSINPNGRGVIFHSIYHHSQQVSQEFISYSFRPGIWTHIQTR